MTLPPRARCLPSAAALVLAAACATPAAHAQSERESLEALRQTTLALIELLVQNGTLSREKADALLAEAKKRADAATGNAAAAAQAAPQAKAEPPVVRVPYVPQVVRDQIRNEVREEVIARARTERWGVPNATAEWTDRIAIEGDLRLRQQSDRAGRDNPSPTYFFNESLGGATRAVDFATANASGLPTGSTQDDRDRLRLRARLAFNVKVSDSVTAGLRLATGSATDRVSTNQTLGQNFNRYQFLLDRAYVKLDPVEWFSFSAGRMPNPWFSTDMVFSDNLNFEGVAAAFRWPVTPADTLQPFATVGYFPLRENTPTRRGRALAAAQVGAQWDPTPLTRLKLGLAYYRYNALEGRPDEDYGATGPGPTYGQYEYEAGLRQRGNTLFLTNSLLEFQRDGIVYDRFKWGLASKFHPVALTVAAEFSHFAPYVIGFSGELVRNTGYGRQDVIDRVGLYLDDARVFGVQVRGTVGMQQVRSAGDWQLSLGYRWLGSDAVPDAFVDSDLGGGGTNIRGLMAGFNYGLARDTALGVRYLSGRTISSPAVVPGARDRYGLDTMQVDLNVRF